MLLSRQPATLESLRCTLDNEYEKVATVEVVLHAFTASASFQSASAAYWSVVNVLGSSLLFSTLLSEKIKRRKKQITVVEYFTLTSYTCHKILQLKTNRKVETKKAISKMQKCRSLKIKVDQQSTARQQCLPKK